MEEKLSRIHKIIQKTMGFTRYEMWIRPSNVLLTGKLWVNIFAHNHFAYQKLLPWQSKLEVAIKKECPHFFCRVFPPQGTSALETMVVLDRYICGQENRFAASLLKELVFEEKWEKGPVSVYGQKGVGKTYYLDTLSKARSQSFKYSQVLWWQGRTMEDHLKGSKRLWKEENFLQKFSLWIIDDFEMASWTLKMERQFMGFLKTWLETSRPLVISSTKPLPTYPFQCKKLQSFLSQGIAFRLDPPQEETRLAIVYASFPEAIHFPQEWIQEIAKKSRLPEEIQSHLNRLKADPKSFSTQGLKNLEIPITPKQDPYEILEAVAKYLGFSEVDWLRRSHKRKLTKGKKIAAFLLHHHLSLSHKEVENYLGKISYASFRRYIRACQKDENLQESCKAIWEELLQRKGDSPKMANLP